MSALLKRSPVPGCLWSLVAAATIHASTLYGISSNGTFAAIDPQTGAGTIIGSANTTNTNALVTSPGGVLYTVDARGGGDFILDAIDPTTGAASPLVDITGLVTNLSVSGLAFSSTGALFASVEASGLSSTSLYTIDTSTGVATLVGLIEGGCCVTDIAFSPSGQLYGWDLASNTGLLTIDPATGAGTVVQGVATPLGITALTFDSTGVLFGAQSTPSSSSLYLINTGTGAPTLIGSIGSFSTTGLAFAASVPEPKTISLSVGGFLVFLGLGILLRRRNPALQ